MDQDLRSNTVLVAGPSAPILGEKRRLSFSSSIGSTDIDLAAKKPNIDDKDNNAKELKKRLPSCDLCRLRKVKCVKTGENNCEGCISLDQTCEYTHERRKPGPANSFANKNRQQRHGSSTSSPNAAHGHAQHPTAFERDRGPSSSQTPPIWSNQPAHGAQYLSGGLFDHLPASNGGFGFNDHQNISSSSSHPIPDLSFMPISPTSPFQPRIDEETFAPQTEMTWPWATAINGWDASDPTLAAFVNTPSAILAQQPITPNPNSAGPSGTSASAGRWHMRGQGNSPKAPVRLGSYQAALKDKSEKELYAARESQVVVFSGPQSQRLEDVLEWSVMMRILHAYHAHLYPITPLVHWPTFSQQLIDRADERSESWRGFLLSLVAYSIIQLPRSCLSFVPVDKLRKLHQKCYQESWKLQNRKYKELRILDVKSLYCCHVYLGTLGRTHAAAVALAEAIRLAQILGLHDENTAPKNMRVTDREMRRRIFWLLYAADRTDAALAGHPLHIADYDLNLPLPAPLDDNLITTSGAFPQPPDVTPVLAGFHFSARLFRLLGAVITAKKTIAATWRDPEFDPYPTLGLPKEEQWIRSPSQFFAELERIISELPGPLQLGNEAVQDSALGDGENPDGWKDQAAFATCRANLLITQAVVRFAIRQYAQVVGEPDAEGDCKDWAEKDVLSLLEHMSPESLAANGNALQTKLLFVASSLLEKYNNTEGQNYVSDFLAVYTRMSEERSMALFEPGSRFLSRETSPAIESPKQRLMQSWERGGADGGNNLGNAVRKPGASKDDNAGRAGM